MKPNSIKAKKDKYRVSITEDDVYLLKRVFTRLEDLEQENIKKDFEELVDRITLSVNNSRMNKIKRLRRLLEQASAAGIEVDLKPEEDFGYQKVLITPPKEN